MVIKSYIIFEMTPGFYGAKLDNKSYEEALFGKEINKLPFIHSQKFPEVMVCEIFLIPKD